MEKGRRKVSREGTWKGTKTEDPEREQNSRRNKTEREGANLTAK